MKLIMTVMTTNKWAEFFKHRACADESEGVRGCGSEQVLGPAAVEGEPPALQKKEFSKKEIRPRFELPGYSRLLGALDCLRVSQPTAG